MNQVTAQATDLPTLTDYKVHKVLGTGDVGTVYLATHIETQGLYAVKVLSPEIAEHLSFSKRFLGEAEIIRGLNHPNVVQVFEGHEDEGQFYFSMEYLRKGSLSDRLKQNLSIETISFYLTQLASGLTHVHSHHYFHGDLKPDNVLIGENERLVLTDFGMAEVVNTPDSISALTAGYIVQSPYLSPEQLNDKLVDSRSNWYSLGIMAYEMLCGQLPEDERCSLPEHLAAFQSFIDKATAEYPNDRFQNEASFIEAFQEACLEFQGTLALPKVASLGDWQTIKNELANQPTFSLSGVITLTDDIALKTASRPLSGLLKPVMLGLLLGVTLFLAYVINVPSPSSTPPAFTTKPKSTPISLLSSSSIPEPTSRQVLSLPQVAEHYRTLPRYENGHIRLQIPREHAQ